MGLALRPLEEGEAAMPDKPEMPDDREMQTLTIALWATNLAVPLNGIAGWTAAVDTQMAAARAAGARLFVMPEYACVQWLSFAPADLPAQGEIAWMAAQGETALDALGALARKHDMALLAGTMPHRDPAPGDVPADGPSRPLHVNRAWLFLPDGRRLHYDKLVLTPGEKDPQAWNLAPGGRIAIVEWAGARLTPLICLDIEMPALAARLAPLDLDLILVPSMTAWRSGYNRVFDCAKARAVELMAAVCTVGAIGVPARLERRESNTSGAAVFTPCETALGMSGVVERIGPWERVDGPGPMLVAALPIGAMRRMRRGAAEAWPGPWSADHLTIEEA
jgi:predicted amidohydrolase